MSRHVVLTGGATGIGAALLQQLKATGAFVTVMDTAPVEGADQWLPEDLTRVDDVASAAARIDGPVDALLCNAGLPPRGDNGASVLAVNVFGVMVVIDALLPKLSDGGAIVTTASRAGQNWQSNLDEVQALLALQVGDSDRSHRDEVMNDFISRRGIDATRAYNLSKEAVIYWSKQQVERLLPRQIRINTVSPAPVTTGILDDFVSAFGSKAQTAIDRIGRAGSAEDIAQVIAFLAGPEAAWINGQDIVVDGGLSALLELDSVHSKRTTT